VQAVVDLFDGQPRSEPTSSPLRKRIKGKTTYRVEFDTEDLILAAARAVRGMPKIERQKIVVGAARIEVKRGGTEVRAQSVREEEPAFRYFAVPDVSATCRTAPS